MGPDRTLSELTVDLAKQASDLIRNEARLARVEAVESIRGMGAGLVRAALGVAFAGAAVTLLLLAIVYALGETIPMWGAALISALIGGVAAYICIQSGLKALSFKRITMSRTSAQVAQDLHTLREHVPS